MKCKNCRFDFGDLSNLVIHSELNCGREQCQVQADLLVYLNTDQLPSHFQDQIQTADWSKGRLYCPKCAQRLGSFDFISGTNKCQCGAAQLPSPVHLVKRKIDQ